MVFFQSEQSFALVYRAHSICFQFLFPSLLVLLIEMKEKKTCAGNAANRMQVKNQSDNDHVMYLPRFLLQRFTVDHVKAMNRALFS